ncbi:MAG: hypothetical protein ACRETL_06115, partial [Gammaproteobacteria bacterium]
MTDSGAEAIDESDPPLAGAVRGSLAPAARSAEAKFHMLEASPAAFQLGIEYGAMTARRGAAPTDEPGLRPGDLEHCGEPLAYARGSEWAFRSHLEYEAMPAARKQGSEIWSLPRLAHKIAATEVRGIGALVPIQTTPVQNANTAVRLGAPMESVTPASQLPECQAAPMGVLAPNAAGLIPPAPAAAKAMRERARTSPADPESFVTRPAAIATQSKRSAGLTMTAATGLQRLAGPGAAAPKAAQPASAESALNGSLPEMRRPWSRNGDGMQHPPRNAGPVKTALTLARTEMRTLGWRLTVRLDELTAEIMAPAGIDRESGLPPAAADNRRGVAAAVVVGSPVRISPVLARPAGTDHRAPLKTAMRGGSGVFVPQLKLGPLRPRMMWGAPAETGTQKNARRG